jgi:hypothetical protein
MFLIGADVGKSTVYDIIVIKIKITPHHYLKGNISDSQNAKNPVEPKKSHGVFKAICTFVQNAVLVAGGAQFNSQFLWLHWENVYVV